jgi:ketosteroid isomerase-like protein
MIRQRRTAFVNAFNRADVDAIAEFLTADLVSMPPNQPSLIGKEASRAWFQEGFKLAPSSLSESIQGLQVLGEWAIERLTWTLEPQSTAGGVPAKDNGKGLHIWRREGDAWRIAQAIWNSDNPIPTTSWSGATAATT